MMEPKNKESKNYRDGYQDGSSGAIRPDRDKRPDDVCGKEVYDRGFRDGQQDHYDQNRGKQ